MATQTLPMTGRNVKAAMAERHISQRALAQKLGVTQPTIFRRLSGDVDFSVSELTMIADVLGVPIEALLTSDRRTA